MASPEAFPPAASEEMLVLLPELREAHTQLLPELGDIEVLFLGKNYDLTSRPGERFRQVTAMAMAREVWRSDAGVLLLWEPLWMRHLADHLLMVIAWKLGGLWHSRASRPTVCYAMENADREALLGGGRHMPNLLVKLFFYALGHYVAWSMSHIILASEASRELYSSMRPARLRLRRTVLDLPAASPHPRPDRTEGAVFVARLAEHKGVIELMAAWELVEVRVPRTTLTVVGGGPLHGSVLEWAGRRPESRRFAGELSRAQALSEMARATVLALPSKPRRRWKEQIGLPIKEALSLGLTVVTTSDTGLAPWLQQHGHQVVPPGDAEALATALISALESPLGRAEVLASLPSVDGWVYAFDLARQPAETVYRP